MKCLFSNFFVVKLSICVVTLSSLYSKVRFSLVAPGVSFRSLTGAFKALVGNKMPKYERAILVLRLFT